MTEAVQGTKDRILNVALDLFSTHGFANVSVRDIGKAVGIKESSLYYHFTNKQQILNTILVQVEQRTENHKAKFNQALHTSESVVLEAFVAAGVYYVENYLLEENFYKIIRMLTIEKQHNKQISELYYRLLFEEPLQHQMRVFSFLIHNDFIQQENSYELATEYQALILFIYHKYFSGSDVDISVRNVEAIKELERLLVRFYKRYL